MGVDIFSDGNTSMAQYFKYGIYRSFISKYKQEKMFGTDDTLPTQIVFYDEVRRGNSIEEVDFNINPKLIPID